MFYVVYLTEIKRHIIIPKTWIYDAEAVFEKFTNTNGLNSSQVHLCYFSTNADAMVFENEENIPNGKFRPNFLAAPGTEFPLDEGTFFCEIEAFRGKPRTIQPTQRPFSSN